MINKIIKLFAIIHSSFFIRKFIITGVAASVEHHHLATLLHPNTIIDVGANRGQFALLCRSLFPNAKIIAFEPLTKSAEIFQKLFINDANIQLMPCALGKQHAQMVMHISHQDDSSSLLPITQQAQVFPGTEEKDIQTVTVYRLDEILTKKDIISPALLKIDVQGYELEVLEGGQSLLQLFDMIYVECSFFELYEGQALANQVIAFLQNQGFQLSGFYNPYYDKKGRCVQADLLFENIS